MSLVQHDRAPSPSKNEFNTLSDNIALKEDKWTRLDVSANGSNTFTFGTSSSKYGIAIVFTGGYGDAYNGMYILVRSASTFVKTVIKDATNFTITMDGTTGVVTIANTASVTGYAVIKPITAGVYFT